MQPAGREMQRKRRDSSPLPILALPLPSPPLEWASCHSGQAGVLLLRAEAGAFQAQLPEGPFFTFHMSTEGPAFRAKEIRGTCHPRQPSAPSSALDGPTDLRLSLLERSSHGPIDFPGKGRGLQAGGDWSRIAQDGCVYCCRRLDAVPKRS